MYSIGLKKRLPGPGLPLKKKNFIYILLRKFKNVVFLKNCKLDVSDVT